MKVLAVGGVEALTVGCCGGPGCGGGVEALTVGWCGSTGVEVQAVWVV